VGNINPGSYQTGQTPQVPAKFGNVGGEVNTGQVGAAVQDLMEQGHGMDPVAGVLKDLNYFSAWGTLCLKVEKAGDDLEVVFDPVVGALPEGFFKTEAEEKGGDNQDDSKDINQPVGPAIRGKVL
jgi:hypothetical protein